MNRMEPVEVMVRVIEEVKLLLLANPDENHALTKTNLITYALIKITKTGGIYAKGINKWQKRPPQDRKKWAEFLAHLGNQNGAGRICNSHARHGIPYQ